MVMNNQSWEEQTRKILTETQAEMVAVGNQLAELQRKYEILQKEAEAYAVALQGYLRRSGKQPDIDWNKLLANALTHKDRIKIIAEYYGVVRPNQLTDVLYPRFIKSKKRANAYQIVQMNLANMMDASIIEKSDTGEYRLVGSQQKLPVS